MQATQKPNLNIPSPQTLTAKEVAEALGSDLQAGLTARKARARLKLTGKNLIQREIEFRASSSFKGQLSGMINLLFLCAMLVLYLFSQQSIYLLSMGIAVLLMLFGTGAELLASRIMRSQEKYSALAVRVIRDGKEGSPFKTAYEVMMNWGAKHGAISYGHIGADLITMCSMLRIPVCMHNVPDADIFRPAAWNAFGMDKEGQDYRACQTYGPLYK